MSNPFFEPSPLPYQLPPFRSIRDDDYPPAFDRGMAEQLDEIAAITADPTPPTFENTLRPLELSGQLLDRALRVFYSQVATDSNERLGKFQTGYAARFSAHHDAIVLDSALYDRIAQVHADREVLAPEERYLVERYFIEFTLAGAALDDEEKQRLTKLNEQLSTLTTAFEQALLADTNALALVLDDVAELDGLTAGEISAAAAAASRRGFETKFVIDLVLPSAHPHLAALTTRDVRARLTAAQRARGSRGGPHDTRELVLEIARLRADRAKLLGFASHAASVTANNTAGTPAAVRGMLERLAPVAARNARAEQTALEKQAGFPIEAHDWPYYAEHVRAAEHEVDFAAMRPYFEAERVLQDGVFYAATKLYGVTFSERPDLVGYHPDVRVFEVHEEDGTPVGLYLYDLYTRDSKKGGAWMNSLVNQSRLLDRPTAVVCNNLNVPQPAPGEPTLLTYDETRTLFHEFGHALHGLLARVTYPKFAGTAVFRDFVEYPSQVNEMWMLWPEVAAHYARHHETDEPLPTELVDRLNDSRSFNEGFATSEYLAAALLDLAWHELEPEEARSVSDVEAFQTAALAHVGLDNPAVPSRYYSPYFAHIFQGAYAANYYGYIWSEVLAADTEQWFMQSGGLTRENGDAYRTYVIGIGGSADPLESYREWRGRDAPIEPLLERRGLV
ncbi:MAG TPA: M3 family metallopeptidase [Nocardioidaceae bacterium]|nr:M3 family metallopeptidase [Nocardioidaceae bacterium]